MDRRKSIFPQTIRERSLELMDNLKIEIVIALGLIVTFFVITGFGEDLVLDAGLELDQMIIDMGDTFTQFAVAINFLYELVPQTFQVIGIGAIYVKALDSGASPLLFIIGGVAGKFIGQMVLYQVGFYGLKALGKKSNGGASHWLHKYHFLVFLLPPFTGALGDIIMIYAGAKKIPLTRIMPILIIADIFDQIRWVVITMGQLELVNSIEN